MKADVRRKLDMVERVREFVRARAAAEPAYGPVLPRLEELLTRAGTILARQHDGSVAGRAASNHRAELRRKLQQELVHYLVVVGSIASKGQTEVSGLFKLPATNSTNAAFLVAIRSLLAAGQALHDPLVKAGMSEALLDDLSRMVSEFEAASEAARTARRDHMGARLELDSITAELTEQVHLLDSITRYRYGVDSDVMGEWKAARVVLGRPRNGAVPPAPQPTTPVGEVKNAA
ncbi:MAG TPA: hypothetical protein VNG35_04505 [Gemmatimonadales bacterium]|nr:hypothetical protein [Gemmatimonadales bacterium]